MWVVHPLDLPVCCPVPMAIPTPSNWRKPAPEQPPLCPVCSTQTLVHCATIGCGWVVCQACSLIINPRRGTRYKRGSDGDPLTRGKAA